MGRLPTEQSAGSLAVPSMSLDILICLFSNLLPPPSHGGSAEDNGASPAAPLRQPSTHCAPHPTVGDVATPVVQPHPLLPRARVLLVKFWLHCSQTFFPPPTACWNSPGGRLDFRNFSLICGICSGPHSLGFFPNCGKRVGQVQGSAASAAHTEVCWAITG